VLLYNEPDVDNTETFDAYNDDLNGAVDAVVLVRTRLQIRDLRAFVENLCKANKECLAVLVNRMASELRVDVGFKFSLFAQPSVWA
jgi:hypothetical protein